MRSNTLCQFGHNFPLCTQTAFTNPVWRCQTVWQVNKIPRVNSIFTHRLINTYFTRLVLAESKWKRYHVSLPTVKSCEKIRLKFTTASSLPATLFLAHSCTTLQLFHLNNSNIVQILYFSYFIVKFLFSIYASWLAFYLSLYFLLTIFIVVHQNTKASSFVCENLLLIGRLRVI